MVERRFVAEEETSGGGDIVLGGKRPGMRWSQEG